MFNIYFNAGSTAKGAMAVETGAGEEKCAYPDPRAWRDPTNVTIVHATSDVQHSWDVQLMMHYAKPIFVQNRYVKRDTLKP